MTVNLFYEISDSLVGQFGGKYFAAYNVPEDFWKPARYYELMRASDRAWSEQGARVRYVKHRFADVPYAQVDMDEFFLVKLRSVAV